MANSESTLTTAAGPAGGSVDKRIGVYVCHCGTNIAGKVDVIDVAKFASGLPGVVVAREYKFLCSDPGQDLIIKDIAEQRLTGVVVASCSPRMHETTFRGAVFRAELNPFLMTMANIREHCSWVTLDAAAATDKAKALVRAAVVRAGLLEALDVRKVKVHPDTLVVGGGIAGIQAALEVANAGKKVYLVEKTPSIGGHMAKFDKTFPTLDCSACILTPKMVSVGQHKNIEMMTYSEVEDVSGYVGNFKIRVRRKSRHVDEEKCNGCGICWQKCPAVASPARRSISIGGKPLRSLGDKPLTDFRLPFEKGENTTKEDVGAVLEKIRRQHEKNLETRDHSACDLCGLCVRMCRDVVGQGVLAMENKQLVARAPQRCISCGACVEVCHSGHLRIVAERQSDPRFDARPDSSERKVLHAELSLAPNKAIAIPFMQAVPAIPVIDVDRCIHFLSGGCGACKQLCERQAIDYDLPDRHVEFDAGSVIVTTGFQPFDAAKMVQYGYGYLPNVLTALEFELLNNAAGPTGGRIVMANGETPKSVAVIHCVGSRDKNHNAHCSRVCCMMALKYGHLIREKIGGTVYDFYIDMRCFGKGYEEFYNRLLEEHVFFIRGRAGEVTDFAVYEEERGRLVVRCEDTLVGAVRRIPVDMVVLMTGLESAGDAEAVARRFGLSRSRDGFFLEQHPKLGPVATPTDGVFIAGACQGPKDIPDTVAQASAAAAAALSLTMRGEVAIEPINCEVLAEMCAGCKLCNTLCPFSAISFNVEKKVSVINEAVCKGCGTCAASCPGGAIRARHFTDRQLLAEIAGVCA